MGLRQGLGGAVFATALGALVALVVALGGDGSEAAAQSGQPAPNIVVIQTDDQTVEMMRVMERTNAAIAAEGATFVRHFTNYPLCCPSRATLLTGQYAHNHGVLGNSPPRGGYTNFPRRDNLAVWLKAVGYRVGHVGKFLNGYGDDQLAETPYDDVREVPPGWTEWRTAKGRSTYLHYRFTQNYWDDSGDPSQPREGELIKFGEAEEDHKTDVNSGEATALIEGYATASEPFYLQVDYVAPHGGGPRVGYPHPPQDCSRSAKAAPRHADALNGVANAVAQDPSYNERDVSDKPRSIRALPRVTAKAAEQIRQRYECQLESLLTVDEGVDAIIAALRESGELANTYVFFTSDNGFFHGEHRIQGGKGRVYEPSIRVPLLMRGPGVPAGVTVSDLTSNADFATTVVELTGAFPASGRMLDGRSLVLPSIRPWRKTGRELLIETKIYTAIRNQRYKWVEYAGKSVNDGSVELYDLRRDPFELLNLAYRPRYARLGRILAKRLADLRSCAGRRCRLLPSLRPSYQTGSSYCVGVTVRGDDVGDVKLIRVLVDGERPASDGRAPFVIRLSDEELGGGNEATIETIAELKDGRRRNWMLQSPTCHGAEG